MLLCIYVSLYVPSCVCLWKHEHAPGRSRERRGETDIGEGGGRNSEPSRKGVDVQGRDLIHSCHCQECGEETDPQCPIRASRQDFGTLSQLFSGLREEGSLLGIQKPSKVSEGLWVPLPKGTGSGSPACIGRVRGIRELPATPD